MIEEMRAVCKDMAHAMGLVLFPRGCAGCGEPHEVLCVKCARLFSKRYTFALAGTVLGEGFASARYEGPVRHAILAWKDHGDEECDGPFADIMAALLCRDECLARLRGYGHVLVVPTPSSPRSIRARGRDHMMPLARSLARALREQGVDAKACGALEMRGMHGKSVQTRSARQRSRRVAGHIDVSKRMRTALLERRDLAVIIVDDIVTSGATMRACVQAFRNIEVPVFGAASLAYAPATGT